MVKRNVETEENSRDLYISLITTENRREVVAQTQKIFALPLARRLQSEKEILAAT